MSQTKEDAESQCPKGCEILVTQRKEGAKVRNDGLCRAHSATDCSRGSSIIFRDINFHTSCGTRCTYRKGVRNSSDSGHKPVEWHWARWRERRGERSEETEDVKMAPYFIAAQLYWGINHIR